ncbi:uncharacterized protein LOC142616071 [Castanea sativa]|uniref:uncharacterized protein LOC142616071 n=1 Tax=Castanea sativa TaxID=21020 RepID=UPI003F64BF31
MASHAVSLVLIRVDNGVQRLVYYVSKSLYEVESLLRKADYTRRIAKWGTILGAFDIKYMPRTSIKGQVLVDLVVEFTKSTVEMEGVGKNLGGKPVEMISLQVPLTWKLYVDGAANQRGSSVELVVVSLDKITIEKSLRLGFSATNNEAEYEALLVGMAMIQKIGGKAVEVFLDSRNTHVDSLATLATASGQGLPRVILVEDLHRPTKEKEMVQEGTLHDKKGEAEKIRRKASRFWLSEEQKLYKRSFFEPYLLCVHLEAVESLLEELHEGICGSHIGGPFPKATGNRRWLLVDTDYFTKWVNAKPLANVRDVDAKKFIWKNIVTRFGIPHTLISDNGLQFDSKAFRRYCCKLGIRNIYSTLAYPQGNGQAETVNKVLVNGLKKRLDEANGRWVEELPHVL